MLGPLSSNKPGTPSGRETVDRLVGCDVVKDLGYLGGRPLRLVLMRFIGCRSTENLGSDNTRAL